MVTFCCPARCLQALEALENDLQQGDADDSSSSNMPSVSQLSYSTLRTALLNCDYRKFGAGCLPDDVNRASSSVLKGPYVLQVFSCGFISALPHTAQLSSSRLWSCWWSPSSIADAGTTSTVAACIRHSHACMVEPYPPQRAG